MRHRPTFALLACGLAIAAPAGRVWAQAGAADTGTAQASVVAPIAVVREADLDFGTVIVSSTSPGTVTIAPLGRGASYAGGVESVCGSACALPHPARFAVRGEPGRTYQVTLPAQLLIAAPGLPAGVAVRVDSLMSGAASSPVEGRGILSGQGSDRFEVGGTLHLPAAAPAAQYTTQVPVIVDYL